MRSDPSSVGSRTASLFAVAAAAVALAGCATRADAPNSELATAQSSVDRVSATPTIATAAPVEMQSARDKLNLAQRAMANKDYEQARRYAEQAEVDARLAESKVAASRSEQALREIQESIRGLTTEIDRRTGTPAPGGAISPAGTPAGTPVGTPVAPRR